MASGKTKLSDTIFVSANQFKFDIKKSAYLKYANSPTLKNSPALSKDLFERYLFVIFFCIKLAIRKLNITEINISGRYTIFHQP